MRHGRATIIAEWAEERVKTCNVVRRRPCETRARNVLDQIVILRIERAAQIGPGPTNCVISNDCIFDLRRS